MMYTILTSSSNSERTRRFSGRYPVEGGRADVRLSSGKIRSLTNSAGGTDTGGRRPRNAAARSARRTVSSSLRRSEEHTSELQSLAYLVCRLLLEKKKKKNKHS